VCAYAAAAPHDCGKVAHAWMPEDGRFVWRHICTFFPEQRALGVG